MPISMVVLTCGYVESARMSRIAFQYQGGEPFETLTGALTDLAHALFEKWKADELLPERRLRSCCKVVAADPESRFCTTCGASLKVEVDLEQFEQWITNLHGVTADDYGGEEAGSWWPWVSLSDCLARPDEVVEICECAEGYLIASLYPAWLSDAEKDSLTAFEKENGLADLKRLVRSDTNTVCIYGADAKNRSSDA